MIAGDPAASGMAADGSIITIALACTAVAVLFLVVRRALIEMKEKEIRRTGAILKAERDALERQADELEALQAEIEAAKATLAELSTQSLILNRRTGKRATASRRFRHEIGRAEPDRTAFTFRLAPLPGFAERPDARMVVHPAIWRFENDATVWAADLAAAHMLTRSIFNDTAGVAISGSGGEAADGAAEVAAPARTARAAAP